MCSSNNGPWSRDEKVNARITVNSPSFWRTNSKLPHRRTRQQWRASKNLTKDPVHGYSQPLSRPPRSGKTAPQTQRRSVALFSSFASSHATLESQGKTLGGKCRRQLLKPAIPTSFRCQRGVQLAVGRTVDDLGNAIHLHRLLLSQHEAHHACFPGFEQLRIALSLLLVSAVTEAK